MVLNCKYHQTYLNLTEKENNPINKIKVINTFKKLMLQTLQKVCSITADEKLLKNDPILFNIKKKFTVPIDGIKLKVLKPIFDCDQSLF